MSLNDGINSNSPVVSIKRGDTIRWAGQYGVINLTGYTLKCQMRAEDGTLLATMTVTLGDQGTSPGSFFDLPSQYVTAPRRPTCNGSSDQRTGYGHLLN